MCFFVSFGFICFAFFYSLGWVCRRKLCVFLFLVVWFCFGSCIGSNGFAGEVCAFWVSFGFVSVFRWDGFAGDICAFWFLLVSFMSPFRRICRREVRILVSCGSVCVVFQLRVGLRERLAFCGFIGDILASSPVAHAIPGDILRGGAWDKNNKCW